VSIEKGCPYAQTELELRHLQTEGVVRGNKRICLTVIVAVNLVFWVGEVLRAQEHAGEYLQADVVFGARLYADNCSSCHGVDGDSVPGVSFRGGQFRNASSDFDLRRIIANGLPDTAMPPGEYSGAELSGLIAFIRTMGDFDPGTLTLGDVDRGRGVLVGKGDCLSCHRIAGSGSRRAPDLTDIGVRRSAGALERTLLDPDSSMLPVNRPVRVVTRDGKEIIGRRLNEDTFTVQLIDQDERLLSLEKANLREYAFLTISLMPSYEGQLSEQELSDLLAYLLTLKGVD
jgi:putative heme-binding domain-containing protein